MADVFHTLLYNQLTEYVDRQPVACRFGLPYLHANVKKGTSILTSGKFCKQYNGAKLF